tara:strand:- start:2020 stop:2232 length:213 start_codon:yes stop_codon:yes gene_type:complete
MLSLILLPVFVFLVESKDFLETAVDEMQKGATWHYVGKRDPDPTAKAITGRICDPGTDICGKPYILFKLK